MLRKSILALTIVLTPALARAQATVLAASATSSAPGSSPVACLLDGACSGYWSPGSKDAGTDEGIYIQFEKPVATKAIEISVDKISGQPPVNGRLYINGKTQGKAGSYRLEEVSGENSTLSVLRSVSGVASAPLDENVKSVFFKLEENQGPASAIKVRKISFLPGGAGAANTPLVLTLPQSVPATVLATSTLEPVTAYHPANLFDSKYDFAWSTNGKATDGKGQSVVLTLAAPQNLSGMMVWNGYQRSDSHFQANGRVSELEIKGGSGEAQKVALKDQMGMQKVTFPKPISGNNLTLTITGIYPGQQYKDVLISELRLLDTNGKMLLPAVQAPIAAAPAGFQGMVGRSYEAVLHQPVTDSIYMDGPDTSLSKTCDNARIRLREDGTFVIYKDFNYGKADSKEKPANVNAGVMEGNWEPKAGNIRIFGRKYITAVKQSEYLGAATSAAPRVGIFQSELSVKPYSQLTPQEKQTLFAYLWTKKKGPANKAQKLFWAVGTTKWDGTEQNGKRNVEGANYDDLVKKVDAILTELNPLYLTSSVLNDLLLPTDAAVECWSAE